MASQVAQSPVLVPSQIWTMEEEEDVADQLKDESFKKRVEVLDQLIITLKRNGGILPYSDGDSIFRSLGLALTDSNWEIRTKCFQLLQEIMPNLGSNIDRSMALLLNRMIENIGDSKVTVRRMVVQTLYAYMKHSLNLADVFDAIVHVGLENESLAVRREMITALPMLLTKEFVHEDLSNVINCLAKKLLVEDNLKDCSLSTLNTLETMIGERMFSLYLKNLSLPVQKYYLQLSGRRDEKTDGEYLNNGPPQTATSDRTDYKRIHMQDSYDFGIVPSQILFRLNDQKDFRTRAQAVEDLKSIIINVTVDTYTRLMPFMEDFINFLSVLLDDCNFKIINVTLEIFLTLVDKMEKNAHNYLELLTCALLKRMPDNKIVIRQLVMAIVIKMMQSTSPMDVISVMKAHLQHRNSRVRQETINFIIAALLTFPSKDFDIPAICKSVGPTLTDVKRAVRQAALECFATLAQVLGPGQLQPLVSAVDEVELCTDGEGLMAAVQARLARKQLPKLTSDMLVEYATPTPSSATVRSSQQSADTEWIMAVSAGVAGSVKTSQFVDLGFVSSSARSTPMINSEVSMLASTARPFMSAGRGRNRLPWDNNKEDNIGHYSNLPDSSYVQVIREVKSARAESLISEDKPPIPRQTWTGDEEQHNRPVVIDRQQSKRRTTVMGLLSSDDPDTIANQQILQKKQSQTTRADKSENNKDNGSSYHEVKTQRFFLGPIKADIDENVNPAVTFKSESPLPDKASLARVSVTRKKVPPINLFESFDDTDSAKSEDGKSSMNGSLKTIRNSATKKRANKLFDKLEKQNSQQGLQVTSHSAITDNELLKKSSSQKLDERNGRIVTTDKGEMRPVEYNPSTGFSSQDSHSSIVEVVGKGYGDEDTTRKLSPPVSVTRLKERQKLNKGGARNTAASKPGQSSSHFPVDHVNEDKFSPGQESEITLVGKGFFESSPTKDYSLSSVQLQDGRSKQRNNVMQSGLMSISSKSLEDSAEYINVETLHADDQWQEESISMTQSLKEKLAVKQQQRLEEDERRRAERERKEKEEELQKKWEKEEKLKKEKERQQEKLKRLSSAESINNFEFLSISGSASNKMTSGPNNSNILEARLIPAVTPRRALKMNNESLLAINVDSSQAFSDNIEDYKPFKDSDGALRDVIKKMDHDDWETKCEGINRLRRLCKHHPETVVSSLHQIVLALTLEVQNLRSQVSRLAIKVMGELFYEIKKQMDPEVDLATKVLLAKAAESNQFIREDIDKALMTMVENVTGQRALGALIAGGASHKNTQIRRLTAQLLVDLVEKMGSGRILSGVKDITDKILPTTAQFVMDGSQETRYFGRKILVILMAHEDFDRMLTRYLTSNNLRNVQDIVDTLRLKGLGEQPSEISSARSRRSGHGSRSNSAIREPSASSSVDTTSTNQQTKHRGLIRTNDAHMEEVQTLIELLSATNWHQRYDGVSHFLSMCCTNVALVCSQKIKIFDKFLPRLQDSNSKVNLHALKVMLQVTPILKDQLSSVISMTVAAVAPNLSSKNKEIFSTASDILESFIENLDLAMLLQPFSSQAVNATSRCKADLVHRVAYLVEKVYHRKQRQVLLHVLPLLWHLLSSVNTSGALVHGGTGQLRQATSLLVNKLYECMGHTLLDKASAEPGNTQRQMQMLQSMIEES